MDGGLHLVSVLSGGSEERDRETNIEAETETEGRDLFLHLLRALIL